MDLDHFIVKTNSILEKERYLMISDTLKMAFSILKLMVNYGEEETKEEEKVWSHGLDLEVGREMGGIECIEAAKGCMHVC